MGVSDVSLPWSRAGSQGGDLAHDEEGREKGKEEGRRKGREGKERKGKERKVKFEIESGNRNIEIEIALTGVAQLAECCPTK